EVAAGVTHNGRPHLPAQLEYIGAETGLVGGRVTGLEDARVHTAPHVFHEGPEQPTGHIAHREVACERYACRCHGVLSRAVPKPAPVTDRRSRWWRSP